MSIDRYHGEHFPVPFPWRLRRELRLHRPPWWLVVLAALIVTAVVVPVGLLLMARGQMSDQPRIHLIQDMGVQPRFNPQATSELFADGRAMRLPVPGTIARGGLEDDDHYHLGYEMRTGAATAGPSLHYFEGLPPKLIDRDDLLATGGQLFAIHCAPCHGSGGRGDGIINEWALANEQAAWVAAIDLLDEEVAALPDGYLYNAIRHGVRSMPPFGAQLDVEQRWAVVAYMRELQRQGRGEPSE